MVRLLHRDVAQRVIPVGAPIPFVKKPAPPPP